MIDSKTPKKLCFVTTIQMTMDWFVLPIAKHLANNGYEVTLVSTMDDDFKQKVSSFAKTYDLEMKRGGVSVFKMLGIISRLRKFFKKEKFDIVEYATPNASFYASIAARQAGIKVRNYNQWGIRYVSASGFSRFLLKRIEKMTCRYSTSIRAQSPKNMEFGIKEGLYKRSKVKVLGIGGTVGVILSDYDLENKAKIKEEIYLKYAIPSKAFLYGFVGRINKDKGVNELITAFREIEDDNAYLMLVGLEDRVNPIREDLLSWAKDSKRVIFTGEIPAFEVPSYLLAFDLLVHPTYREGFGKILQEAMAAKTPVLTTDVPGPSEVVEDGISGMLVPAEDAKALQEMMEALKKDGVKRDLIAENGRLRAEQYFNREYMVNNHLLDVNELLANSK